MIRFLIKGLIRDKSRSALPIIVVAIGVMLTVFMHAYIAGIMGDTIEMNARFSEGHMKVTTRAYAAEIDQVPNDLAILEADGLVSKLENQFAGVSWASRIKFGGLIDAPDENGETKAQGPAMGIGIDLLSTESEEPARLNLTKSLVRGQMPRQSGEVLISDHFATKLGVNIGDPVTLIGSTMEGGMSMYNFTVAGTLSFGMEAMDRGTIIADLTDVGKALQMEGAAGEILGFLPDGFYDHEEAVKMAEAFNAGYSGDQDEYAPQMVALGQQEKMSFYVELSEVWLYYISLIFIIAMSLVLWNAGLLGGLRRYGEVGIRLAMGEEKRHVYVTMIWESVFIGLAGSVVGTGIGLFCAWLLQKYGLDISGMMEGSSVMMPSVIRARITPPDLWLGFFPGLLSTVIGTMLSGIGIFKRQTARLFKELEA
ncbi:ABC-type transport system [Bacteroidales bacterium 6E]|nr:ABC-type transport system [Bacteroidales bacterium 6E]